MTLSNDEPDITVAPDIPERAETDMETNDTAIDAREVPDAFYDPITKKLMQDPVVTSDGNSYERSTIVEQRGDDIESGGKPYPNRALLAVIGETMELRGDSFIPMVKQLNKTVMTSVRQIFDKSALSDKEFRPLPDVYYCPITFGLIHFPVIDPEGHTFEKVAIEAWIQKNGSSPLTRTSLNKEALYKNRAITALLDEEKRKDMTNIHPSIRRFVDEEPPEEPQISPNPGEARIYLFPTTPEEIAARRRLIQRERQKSFIGLIFVAIFVVVLAFYGVWFLIIPVIGVILCSCSKMLGSPSSPDAQRGR
mmetsp:Transcript_11448/g.13517  ORF Transcript_11448/g.13517 Transcript_11448/m.13517 type:complete len:308 (-) Transcript_11448:113-1036(-)